MRMYLLLVGAILWCPSLSTAAGPFEITARDSTTLRLQLVSQLLGSWDSKDQGPGQDREETVVMKARRIRPTITVAVPRYRTTFRLHLSTAPGSLELMDLYFNTVLGSRTQIRAGQFKIPFTRYRIQSFQRLTFVDWSIVTKYLGAERQMGVAVHNGYEKPPAVGYAAGIFSGVNARASHGVGVAPIYGEKVANPSDLSARNGSTAFHPELVVHLSYNGRGIAVGSDSDAEGGGLRYSAAVSVAWDLDPVAYQDLALRLAPEFLLKDGGVSLMVAGYVGLVEMDGTLRTRRAITGLLTQAAYRISERYEVSARYAVIDVDSRIAGAATARAAGIIEEADDDDITAQYRNAGKVRGEREGTIGFNVYLDGHDLKLQNDVGFIKQDRVDGDRTGYTMRSMVQLSF